ncbi:CX3C chemokine receptor 1-like [Lineus longissimus]|uniref:CX3C chemokine receptor 1-like n=1 Tax=Lineus longissimus TaxID=88925 RepID=UPI00315CEDDA
MEERNTPTLEGASATNHSEWPGSDLIDSTTSWKRLLEHALWVHVPPVLIVSGTILNAITITVLLSRKFGKASTRILLIGLALTDTAVLWTGLLRIWLVDYFDVDVRLLSYISCPLHTFLTYFLIDMASWLVMLLTVERWISVAFPLKARFICRKKWTFATLFCAFACLFMLNSHMLFLFRLNAEGDECGETTTAYLDFCSDVFPWIDLITYSGIPLLVITVCNCSILYKLIQCQNKRKTLQNPGKNPDGWTAHAQMTSMTYMLTAVSVTFLLLTLPAAIYFIVNSSMPDEDIPVNVNEDLDVAFAVTYLSSYVNNTINFLLYCLSGTQFRREVYRMFRGVIIKGETSRSIR